MSRVKFPSLNMQSVGALIAEGPVVASLLDLDAAYVDFNSSGIGYARLGVKRNGAGTSGGAKIRTLNAGTGVDALTFVANGNATFVGTAAAVSMAISGSDAIGLTITSDHASFGGLSITSNATGGKQYRLRSVTGGNFSIRNETDLLTVFDMTAAGILTLVGELITPASATAAAGLRLPHGTAPTSPVNGDVWTTTSGLFVRINGATVGPLS